MPHLSALSAQPRRPESQWGCQAAANHDLTNCAVVNLKAKQRAPGREPHTESAKCPDRTSTNHDHKRTSS
jgi:hypothetical protein